MEQHFTEAVPTKADKFINLDCSSIRGKDNYHHLVVKIRRLPKTISYQNSQVSSKKDQLQTRMASVLAIGVGVAAAAFLVRS